MLKPQSSKLNMPLDNVNFKQSIGIDAPLVKLYERERMDPSQHYMTQPMQDATRTFTWGETAELVRKVAAKIKSYQYAPGSRIAILAKNSAEWVITDLAIMMAGHVSVPIFATAGTDTINYVIEHAACKMLFIGKLDSHDAIEAANTSLIETVSFPYEGIKAKLAWEDFINIAPMSEDPVPDMNQIMTIIYTSGSTGEPKGVVHTYSSICWAAQNSIETLELCGNDRMMSYLPLAHITERVLVEISSLYSGMTLHFVHSLDTFSQDTKQCAPTVFVSVPRLWTKFQMGVLAKVPQGKLNFLLKIPLIGKKVAEKIRTELGLGQTRLWASGSAPLAPATIRWFSTIGINISEGWGMTENCAYGTANYPFREDKIGSIGKPYAGVELRIADDGEIQVKSPCNMIAYYKQPQKTTEVFTNDGYFRTGDKGDIDEEGYIRITGRLKDIFKTDKGKYVVPAPIEARLMENAMIEQVCVTGTNLPQPIALLVLSEDARMQSKDIVTQSLQFTLDALNATLESHQKLDRIIVFTQEWSIDNELLTPTLKVKRHVIEKRFADVIHQKYREHIVWH